jgi:hypothetical protein
MPEEKRREEGGSETHCIWSGARNFISGFAGSLAVPAGPCGRDDSYDRNQFYMALKRLHYIEI